MTQADRVPSTPHTNTPVDTTRRHFLLAVGGGTAAMLAASIPEPAATAPASSLDPVFGLIEAHRKAHAAHLVALEEQDRLERIGDASAAWIGEGPRHADMAAFKDLIETVPQTFASLLAWASYLDEIREFEDWMFEDYGPTLVVSLFEALGNLQISGGITS